ncbi:MAG: amino acid permease [Verrucomicrobiota bacterium]|nr:amino acid permease [Limisphaera sp.]MDW8381611.1 amino acid permease [Verrucomicrobiota bacterium]
MTLNQPRRVLSLFDSTCLIVGIIIGAGIYQMAPAIANGAGGPWAVLGLWFLGGVLSLCGALCYAELATAYPKEGGDYVYLNRAYGSWAGFLFGWAQLTVVRPGDIAVMAFAFATYAAPVLDGLLVKWGISLANGHKLYAAGAVAGLTWINVAGVRAGAWAQNLLTILKAIGLLTVVGAAVAAGQAAMSETAAVRTEGLSWTLALIFVLFTYGGWNEMAYVAAEVRDPKRNILRAMIWGMGAVTALYLLVNGAFLYALGYSGLAASEAVAVDVVRKVWPEQAAWFVAALICISALGAVNGLILTGARISYAVGSDYAWFRKLGRWDSRRDAPVTALLVQGALAVGLILILGDFVKTVIYTAAVVYAFYLATTLAVWVLRRKEPSRERPYRVWGYPVTPWLFALVCAILMYSAVTYQPLLSAASMGIILTGLPIWWWNRRRPESAQSPGSV